MDGENVNNRGRFLGGAIIAGVGTGPGCSKFLLRDATRLSEQAYAVVRCPSMCLSVCHATRQDIGQK